MQKLFGKKLAQSILAELKVEIQRRHLHPGLGVLLVGDDPASEVYTLLKAREGKRIGVAVDRVVLPKGTPQEMICQQIRAWNTNPAIHGILVQLPLPKTVDTNAVIKTIDPRKDVDGFHPVNVQAFQNNTPGIRSPLFLAVEKFLDATHWDFRGKHAVVLGKSDIFLSNMEKLLERRGMQVVVFGKTAVKPPVLKSADVIVTALGRPHALHAEMFRSPVVVLDIGITRQENKIYGDVQPSGLKKIEGFRTPVPGGVGPMTVAMVLSNVVEACKNR